MAGRPSVTRRVRRYDAYLVTLDPIQGSEIAKTRPCVVVSPDELNDILRTVIIVPITTTRDRYDFRVPSFFGGRQGDFAVDHLRSVDRSRLVRRLGTIDAPSRAARAAKLVETFQL
jgi:mRNA interferase MazF